MEKRTSEVSWCRVLQSLLGTRADCRRAVHVAGNSAAVDKLMLVLLDIVRGPICPQPDEVASANEYFRFYIDPEIIVLSLKLGGGDEDHDPTCPRASYSRPLNLS